MQQGDDDDALPGQDSFIDVVCNMVGILIVLVMIVGVRASSGEAQPAPAPAPEQATAEAKAALEKARRKAAETAGELTTAVGRIADLSIQSAITDARRQQLSLVQAAVEQEINQRRSRLDAEGQRQFDVQNQIATAEIKLHELTQEQVALMAAAPDVEQVECVPTPLAKTVTGDEVHVRLRHGQLAVVPADELLSEVKRRGADHLRAGLRNRDSAEDVFGPIDGFRMRLSVERYDTTRPGESPPMAPRRSTLVMQGVFLPTSDDVGQPVEQALLPGSALMRALRSRRSTNVALTVWAYPDSYGELRTIKRAMWEAGIPLAVRPLADGQPIIFSTMGSKSAAQ
jgi:hypothetical protein